MTMNNEYPKFENWFHENYPFTYKGHKFEQAKSNAWEGWNAKTTEANKRIAELQANNHDLREALEKIAGVNASKNGTTPMMLTRCIYLAQKALSATPAESLAKRDDEVKS